MLDSSMPPNSLYTNNKFLSSIQSTLALRTLRYYWRTLAFTGKIQIPSTVEPRYNNPRYNDIPGITMNILCPGKSYSYMFGKEPRYYDLRYNGIPDITMRI